MGIEMQNRDGISKLLIAAAALAAALSLAAAAPAAAFDLEDALGVAGALATMAPHNPPAPPPAAAPPAAGKPKPVAKPGASASIPGLPPRGETRFAINEVLVETKTGLSAADLAAIGRRNRLTLAQSADIALLGTSVHRYLIADKRTVRVVIIALAADRSVIFAQPNYGYSLEQQGASATPLPQYSVDLLHLGAAHAIATGAAIQVGVLDTGIADGNAELADSITDRNDPIGPVTGDDISHGTAIAGIIAAHGQMVGVAPAVAIVSSRAFTSVNGAAPGSTSFILLQGLDWLAGKNVRIVNMSFAGPKDPLFLTEIGKAHGKQILIVAAAGNDGPKAAPDYPAADPNVVGVTAIDEREQLLGAANRGSYVALAAPGVDILVAQPDGGYGTSSGTSMAAAHISGIAALLLQRDPSLGPDKLRQIMVATAQDLGPKGVDPQFGAGLADPEKALQGLPAATIAVTAAKAGTAVAPSQ